MDYLWISWSPVVAPYIIGTVYIVVQLFWFYISQNGVRIREINKLSRFISSFLLFFLYLNKRFIVPLKHLSFKHTVQNRKGDLEGKEGNIMSCPFGEMLYENPGKIGLIFVKKW